MTTATLTLLPPQRLGVLLSEGRHARGRSLTDVASACSFDEEELDALERGDLRLADDQVQPVLDAYGVPVEELIPARSQVVVDLDQGQLLVAEEAAAIDTSAPTADEVLSAYLSLVYTLRHADPGTPLVLRQYDVAVLSRALRLAEPDVEARLTGLMRQPSTDLSLFHRLLRSKLVFPVVGAVVIATGVGTVLVLRAGDEATPPPEPATRPSAVEAPVDPSVSLIPGAVQERNPDGSPGAVQVDP
ncbi:helix-turn-helix domain-containing protein [Rhabdothermincola salaria]|uniref:helix-turn-helix domain-containing protein n=1 Tax=Rhabdothermincola salaria TaxID=2903142 RepID=UPI001E490717|nr:helix-turn-helix transcriptional regulator [Rhabdothermincola salaria]MCD9622457.1 helix-turn-helix domain-containing protein [Rhabdothermincola salaria]